eukprot:6779652-Ditylum_brightwellii.AAC.1
MNSEMFMRWVTRWLVPTFEKKYPGKKMCLIADNAPYHHKGVIGSLNGLSKKKLVGLGKKHGVTYLKLPNTAEHVATFEGGDEHYENIQDRGEYCSIELRNDDDWKAVQA